MITISRMTRSSGRPSEPNIVASFGSTRSRALYRGLNSLADSSGSRGSREAPVLRAVGEEPADEGELAGQVPPVGLSLALRRPRGRRCRRPSRPAGGGPGRGARPSAAGVEASPAPANARDGVVRERAASSSRASCAPREATRDRRCPGRERRSWKSIAATRRRPERDCCRGSRGGRAPTGARGSRRRARRPSASCAARSPADSGAREVEGRRPPRARARARAGRAPRRTAR